MKSLERLIELILVASRWVLAVFYLGLVGALVLYAVAFLAKFRDLAMNIFALSATDTILAMLSLIDASLVASLLFTVLLSGYVNFVSPLDEGHEAPGWVGKLDSGTLKVKLAASIVAISSIHLLQVFLNVEHFANDKILWLTVLHITFLASAFLLAALDRMSGPGKKA